MAELAGFDHPQTPLGPLSARGPGL
jgi:hypothetical protein